MQIGERALGQSGIKVNPIGLGGMPLSIYGSPTHQEAVKVIEAALQAGINFIDTADVYCHDETDIGHNERLISGALKTLGREDVIVATKGGLIRPRGAWLVDGRPDHLREACEASCKALNREQIDLYYLHAPDDKVPFHQSVETLAELKQKGKIKNVGLSNVSKAEIKEAQKIVEIAAVQNRCNPYHLHSFEGGIVSYCEDNNIAFVAYSPVGGGSYKSEIKNHPDLNKIGKAHGKTPFQVVLAWLLSLSPNLIAIPGASRIESIESSAGVLRFTLTNDEIKHLNQVFGLKK